MRDGDMHEGDRREGGSTVVIEAAAISTTRALLAGWPLVLVVGAVISLLASSIIPFAISVVVFAALGWFAWPRLQSQWLWSRPELHLASPVLRLGEQVSFTFEQTSRRPIDVGQATLTTQLICQEFIEWETRRDGERKTHTRDKIVAASQQSYTIEPTRTGLRSVGHLTVPATSGGPALRLDNHRISWRLETKLEGARLPRGTETFDINVVPEFAAPPQPTPVQDTLVQDTLAQHGVPAQPDQHASDGRMNPYIHLDDVIAEAGQAFSGHVTYAPEPGSGARVRGLVLQLQWRTDGRGDTDEGRLEEVRIPAREDGRIDDSWSLPIPPGGPISYHGDLMSIDWTLTATLDIQRRLDPDWSADVVVVPRHGRTQYAGPHPLRRFPNQ